MAKKPGFLISSAFLNVQKPAGKRDFKINDGVRTAQKGALRRQ